MNRLLFEFIGSSLSLFNKDKLFLLGKFLGYFMWATLSKRRKISIGHIKYHLGVDDEEAIKIAKNSFIHSGVSFIELLMKRKVDFRFMKEHVKILNMDIVHRMVNIKRPIVSVTAHIGSWELLGGLLALVFRNKPAQIVVRHPKNEAFKEFLIRFRSAFNVKIVSNKESAPIILSCLKKKGIVAFLVDQNCGRRWATFLKFFNDWAAVNMGPALVAVRSKALVWPVFLLKDRNNLSYIVETADPLDTAELNGNVKDKVRQVASFYTKEVEKIVKKYPDQWFWMHRRWKTRPPWEAKIKGGKFSSLYF